MMILVGNRRKREYLSMEKVYVVEEFNDERTTKEVKAIFKDKKKAEEYCSCHIDCSIKECNYSDDKTYTPFNRVLIQGKINGQSFPSYTFQRLSKEDDDSESKEFVYVFQSFGDTNVKFVVNKILTDNYDEETEKLKYEQILQDIMNISKIQLEEIQLEGFEQTSGGLDSTRFKLTKIIAEKFNIKFED